MSIALNVPMPRSPAGVLRTLLRELENLDPQTVTADQLRLILDDARTSL